VNLRVIALLAIAACGHDTGPPPPPVAQDSNATFVAFPETFASFRTWTSFHDNGPPDDGTFGPDVLGPRTQYINMTPPHGSTQFPVGTVIVEARESGAMLIIAGVKRGGGYNLQGATNWEWFGLTEDPTGAVSIKWRGLAPPVGGYGGLPMGGCNDCHMSCGSTNDFVCSPELQLASF
jgi:hypothetical protein